MPTKYRYLALRGVAEPETTDDALGLIAAGCPEIHIVARVLAHPNCSAERFAETISSPIGPELVAEQTTLLGDRRLSDELFDRITPGALLYVEDDSDKLREVGTAVLKALNFRTGVQDRPTFPGSRAALARPLAAYELSVVSWANLEAICADRADTDQIRAGVAKIAAEKTDRETLTHLAEGASLAVAEHLPWPDANNKPTYISRVMDICGRALKDAGPGAAQMLAALSDTWEGTVGGLLAAVDKLEAPAKAS